MDGSRGGFYFFEEPTREVCVQVLKDWLKNQHPRIRDMIASSDFLNESVNIRERAEGEWRLGISLKEEAEQLHIG